MGRTNGKLIPFLKEALLMEKYINLTYESEVVFCIELPRYEQHFNCAFETMLKDWYMVNGRLEKYENYSSAKSVFQAALKKSLYLIPLPKNGKILRFRFSVSEEIEEKRKVQKEKTPVPEVKFPVSPSDHQSSTDENMDLLDFLDEGFQVDDGENHETQEVKDCVAQFTDPPSVTSSGYHSDSGDDNADFMAGWLNLEDYFQVNEAMQELPGFEELMDGGNNELSQSLGNLDLPAAENSQNVSVTGNQPALQELELQQHTPVRNQAQNIWVCKSKIQIGSLLELVCELAVPELGVDEKAPDMIFFGGMLEAGKTYDLKKAMRVDSYLLLIFNPPC